MSIPSTCAFGSGQASGGFGSGQAVSLQAHTCPGLCSLPYGKFPWLLVWGYSIIPLLVSLICSHFC